MNANEIKGPNDSSEGNHEPKAEAAPVAPVAAVELVDESSEKVVAAEPAVAPEPEESGPPVSKR